MSTGMTPVLCEHCGEELGWVAEGVTPDPKNWVHTRCMTRVAKQWEVPTEFVTSVRDVLAASQYCCYPDLGGSGEHGETMRLLRSKMAAEVALETLASNGLRVTREGK